jgi:carbonic anhydrase
MKLRIGLIYGVPASIRNKYISGAGVGSCNRSVMLAKIRRATEKRSVIQTQLPNMQTQDQLTAHTAKAMVLTCMDFRLIDDAFILAGASLGYNQPVYSAWSETFDKHIELAEQLHDIKDVIVVDHMQCGAYKIFYNQPSISRENEINMHKENFTLFRQTMNRKYPQLTVTTLLMDLDGSIIPV